ncbi:phosphatidylglycerol lysyltransferase domain-containing protein, partial [Micromonospora sp. KC721]|uniref:phosphatidylglycerol lysyltransferase domain-containing protein n=1 Tax=Micromonospora sp. KC721 TaxID=2530380 RepID=UPI0010466D4C
MTGVGAGMVTPVGDAAPSGVAVSDRLTVRLPADATALVCGDLRLGQARSAASSRFERDLVGRLGRWSGPGGVVLNGDVFELWGEPGGTVGGALDAHPALTAALRDFSREPGRELVVVVGDHDAAIAWDGVSAAVVADRLGGRCALSVDLCFDTPAGPRVVRCEHGHAFDPANALRDPRNPLDSPLGQHIVQEVLPHVRGNPMLADAGALTDPGAIGPLVASRLVYRRLGSRVWWLLLPALLALALRAPFMVRLLAHSAALARVERWLLISGITLVADLVLLVVLAVLLARTVYASLAGSRLGPWGSRLNGPPKAAAAALCEAGLAGFITGHTHRPELAAVAGGFYANSGCATRAVEARRARWFLPPVFLPVLRRSWVEVDVAQQVRARLVVGESPAGEATLVERLVVRRHRSLPDSPAVVATVPGQAGWPVQQEALARRVRYERVRRRAALTVGGMALLNLASAVTPPLRDRLAALLEWLPVEAPQAAAAGVVFVSVALLLVAWGLRRGRSLAFGVASGLLVASAVLHLVKGLDVGEALLAVVVAGWLLRHRAAFPTHPDRGQVRAAVAVLLAGGALVVAVSLGLTAATGAPGTTRHAARVVAARMVGATAAPLPSSGRLVEPALTAVGCSLLLGSGWLLLRPRRHRRPGAAQHRADLARARAVVRRYGGDTLGYFALRSDKTWFFTGDCVVAYQVRDGVCLVSPDPIGPPEQWADAWAQFLAFADRHGWPVTVVGAAEGWLPVYQAAGLRPVYLGDEAIVDCGSFSLDGRPMKGLRSAYRRVQRAGYTTRFYDPATLPPALADELRRLSTQSRHGAVERGFSMTLSRLFDPADAGLLLTVAYGPDGRVDAFCQWTPAADIAGWSLDVMRRRSDVELPNGLTDFLIIDTVQHLRARGQWGLGLNFAVMRSVLAG